MYHPEASYLTMTVPQGQVLDELLVFPYYVQHVKSEKVSMLFTLVIFILVMRGFPASFPIPLILKMQKRLQVRGKSVVIILAGTHILNSH